LEIKPDTTSHRHTSLRESLDRKLLADFSSLTQLRVLGLMDVTTTFVQNVPDDNEEHRVRTSLSTVNTMAYGIADNLGKHAHLNMLDLVQPEFRDRKDEAIFAMFGRAQLTGNNPMAKFLHDKFVPEFTKVLDALDPDRGEGVEDALRRTFLNLNKSLHDYLYGSDIATRKTSHGTELITIPPAAEMRGSVLNTHPATWSASAMMAPPWKMPPPRRSSGRHAIRMVTRSDCTSSTSMPRWAPKCSRRVVTRAFSPARYVARAAGSPPTAARARSSGDANSVTSPE